MVNDPIPDQISLTGNLFSFHNPRCECLIDTSHQADGTEIKTLRIKSVQSNPALFAYLPHSGLASINPATGSVKEQNLFGSLISIPYDNIDKMIEFFSAAGFFVEISDQQYEAFRCEDIFELHRRIRFTSELMSLIESPRKNYRRILGLTFWLLFMHPVELKSCNPEVNIYQTCRHKIQQYISDSENASEDETLFHPSPNNDPTEDYYLIPDSIRTPNAKIWATEYSSCMNGQNEYGYTPSYTLLDSNSLLFMYKNFVSIPKEDRQLIEFLYHFQTEIGSVDGISKDATLHFNADPESNYIHHFDECIKNALISIARNVIKEEIDYGLSRVVPSYDAKKMTASWYIPDLLTGLYFSLFYLHPDMEIYRECANPNCNQYFLVKTTNSKRKYCCPECANATAQRMHRKRLKEKESP